jgi:hypothetical protein
VITNGGGNLKKELELSRVREARKVEWQGVQGGSPKVEQKLEVDGEGGREQSSLLSAGAGSDKTAA